MADIKKIDKRFSQEGPCCVVASYSIIQNYFSDNNLSVDEIIFEYCDFAQIDKGMAKKEREQKIQDAYQDYCEPKNMRGFDYIRTIIHESDKLHTKSISHIVESRAGLNKIDDSDVDKLKEKLKKGDRLAMVLYYIPVGEAHLGHAVVVGWDSSQQSFFVKDPNDKMAKPNDILSRETIFEYILFEK